MEPEFPKNLDSETREKLRKLVAESTRKAVWKNMLTLWEALASSQQYLEKLSGGAAGGPERRK